MRRGVVLMTGALAGLAAPVVLRAAESYQPKSNVTLGIYADLRGALRASVWEPWGSGFAFVDDGPHGGKACIRCVGRAGTRGQGVGQAVQFDQAQPRPIKIAGWSRCEGVRGEKGYTYSLYVDFVLADGKPLHMQIAAFGPGTHGWQYAETVVEPPQAVRSARFHAFIRENDGTVWFDDLFLGEVGGRNLLRGAGFEENERVDLSRRQKLFADLQALHCNALHGYLSGSLADWEAPPSKESEIVGFLQDAHRHGVGVWLTIGLEPLPIRDASDPSFPQHECVNGDWGRRWTNTLAKVARYPFAALSTVPDEYNWNNYHLKRAYAKHADPKVRDFYAKLGAYCDCPTCRHQFTVRTTWPFPGSLPAALRSSEMAWRRWLLFRYDSTTDWLRRTCAAVKKVNPAIRTDSLICVTPLCSDFWYGPGVAWDRAGYEAGLEYATTDPYIQLHNYLGDSTHWYVTETAEHLAAASPERRCGVVLEASRIRKEFRELDPVEIYGSALSAVWHGADELAWWHHNNVMGTSPATARPEVSRACVSGVYGLLEKIDPWLDGVTPEPGIALLFSRASCDFWRLYLEAKDGKPPFDTHGITDPRYGSIAQKEVLYCLLRLGYPTTLYYLESVREAELEPHKVIVVPFPLSISENRARLLERLARGGKHVVVIAQNAPLDEEGTPRPIPALRDLCSAEPLPPRTKAMILPGEKAPVKVYVYGEARTSEWCAVKGQFADLCPIAIKHWFVEKGGEFVFIPRHLGALLPASRDNEKRTHSERILPSALNPDAAKLLTSVIDPPLTITTPEPAELAPKGDQVAIIIRLPALLWRKTGVPEGDDVELCLSVNRRGEKLLLAINWDGRERAVEFHAAPFLDRAPTEAYRIGPDGVWGPWKGSVRPELRLKPQEALVARLARE